MTPVDRLWRRLLLAFVGAALAWPGGAAASPLDGIWRNRNGTVEIRVAPCGPNVCGTVVAARGDALVDARAGGLASLVGTRVMHDYALRGDGTWHGRVFVPQLGRTLPSRIRFVDRFTVEVSGCVLGGIVCKTKVWRRVSS
jgi:uncharacterized protein (DUF2147 family)